MATLLILLLWCAHVCKGPQATAVDTSDDTNSIERIIVNSYDVSRTFDENFYSILGIICPQSIYCSGNESSTMHGNGNVFQKIMNDETSLSTNATSTNQSYPISEARANLKAKVDALHVQGCCTSCSCEDDCVEKNNCCPAMEQAPQHADDIEPEKKVIQECVYANIKTYLEVEFALAEADGHSYFMVTDCFTDNVSEELTTKCRRPDTEFPDEIIPVYSASSGRNYKNRFCAECNNDNNVTAWLVNILFNKEFSLTGFRVVPSTPAELYKSLAYTRFINVYYIPPTNLHLQSKTFECIISNPETVSDKLCDQNNDFDSMKFLTRACAAHQINFERSRYTYKNAFCFLCPTGEQKNCAGRLLRSLGASIGALLDVGKIKPGSRIETTRKTETPCSNVEYFDQKKKICRDLQCPPGEAFDDDTCVAFLRNIKNLRMKMFLEIYPEEPDNPATERFMDQLDEKISTFERKLNRFLKVRWGVTNTINSLIFRETSLLNSSHIKLYYVTLFSFEGMADNRAAIESMINALRVAVSVRILDSSLKLTLGRIFDVKRTSIETQNALVSLSDSFMIFEPIGLAKADLGPDLSGYRFAQTLNKLAYCKRVVLEADEIELLRNNSSAVGLSHTYLEYVFYDKDGSMCLEDFETAFLPLDSKSVPLRLHTHVVYLACLVFCIYRPNFRNVAPWGIII